MITTIQVNEKTKLPHKKSMAGSLKKYLKKGETAENIIKEMHKERRENNRF